MNSFVTLFFAACCGALSNLFFRKNTDRISGDQSINNYLLFYYGSSFIFACIAFPKLWSQSFDCGVFCIGSIVGILNLGVMGSLGKSLELGPSGLTFAFLNSSAVFPGLLLFLVFGSAFGYSYSIFQLFGVALVIGGLFYGTRQNEKGGVSHKWLFFALLCMFLQISAFSLIQGRCILWQCRIISQDDLWFLPGQFIVPFLILAIVTWYKRRPLYLKEISYGTLGGISNFIATALLLLATASVLPEKAGIILPFFAVSIIILSNLWSWWLYNESFNWVTNLLCAAGIFVGLYL